MSQYYRNHPDEPIRHCWLYGAAIVKPRYYIKQFARGRWHVMCPSGLPLYDNAPHGKDKPIIFDDEDAARACAQRCNLADDEQ